MVKIGRSWHLRMYRDTVTDFEWNPGRMVQEPGF
jgi:hypothetical protein